MHKLRSGLLTAGRILAATAAVAILVLVLVPMWVGVAWTLVKSWIGVLAGVVLVYYLVLYVLERWLGVDMGLGLTDSGDNPPK